MTEQEAIMDLQEYIASGEHNGTNPPIYLATANISIKALEKQIAKKVVIRHCPKTSWTREVTQFLCPICNMVIGFNGTTFCSTCGQKLDWRNEDA